MTGLVSQISRFSPKLFVCLGGGLVGFGQDVLLHLDQMKPGQTVMSASAISPSYWGLPRAVTLPTLQEAPGRGHSYPTLSVSPQGQRLSCCIWDSACEMLAPHLSSLSYVGYRVP